VCLWEAGLTLDFHQSSPLPKGTRRATLAGSFHIAILSLVHWENLDVAGREADNLFNSQRRYTNDWKRCGTAELKLRPIIEEPTRVRLVGFSVS